jgi:magnesium chelatase subunit I
MDYTKIKTLKDLKKSGYQAKSIKDELRSNLIEKIKNNEAIFESIIGYDETVIPQLKTAILSKHNINLLGLRGQAKTRIARSMTELLNEYIPVIEGSPLNDDPMCPVSSYGKNLIAEKGDETPIAWLHRADRFYEKLATPDVSVADLIGDIDPIKAAAQKLSYADERVIHFGMIPRANRCIFVINELPDLQARIQVSLFNILQEGDVQIRGFNIRLPLDINFVFTANPEDYTNRGSIVTPLKDRIGSQILTHYPKDIETAKKITRQEAHKMDDDSSIYVPEIARTLIEQIGFEARKSPYIDANSGVSARMGITMYENLISRADLRKVISGEEKTSVRMSDFEGIIPAITGKVELVYEGEQLGAEKVAQILVGEAIKELFNQTFKKLKKLKRENEEQEFDDVVQWFMEHPDFVIEDNLENQDYAKKLNAVEPLETLVNKYIPEHDKRDTYLIKELILWGMVEHEKLNKKKVQGGFSFEDELLGSLYGKQ